MAGDPDDWAAWLERHGAALVLLARQRVASQADAEDVVQEAFVRFWRSRHRADDPTAYLYTCVQNCALNWQRTRDRRSRREGAVARPESETEPALAGPPELDDRRATIESVLQSLPDPQREVLVMKVWGGLSFPQIAEALRIPANTAASRYRYALTKLRERLTQEPIS